MHAPTAPLLTLPPLPLRRVECRVFQRFSCELPGFCQPASGQGSPELKWAATACDISQGGMRVLLRRRYEPGAGLAIELPDKDGREGHTYLVKVIHVRPSGGGFWAHGCRFASPLSDDEINRLLGNDHAPGPVPTGKRTIAEVQFQLASSRGPLVDCLIKNLQISQSWPLAAGKIITIRNGSTDKAPWSLRVQVTQCRQEGKCWLLQCQLPQTPRPLDVLRAFSCSDAELGSA